MENLEFNSLFKLPEFDQNFLNYLEELTYFPFQGKILVKSGLTQPVYEDEDREYIFCKYINKIRKKYSSNSNSYYIEIDPQQVHFNSFDENRKLNPHKIYHILTNNFTIDKRLVELNSSLSIKNLNLFFELWMEGSNYRAVSFMAGKSYISNTFNDDREYYGITQAPKTISSQDSLSVLLKKIEYNLVKIVPSPTSKDFIVQDDNGREGTIYQELENLRANTQSNKPFVSRKTLVNQDQYQPDRELSDIKIFKFIYDKYIVDDSAPLLNKAYSLRDLKSFILLLASHDYEFIEYTDLEKNKDHVAKFKTIKPRVYKSIYLKKGTIEKISI